MNITLPQEKETGLRPCHEHWFPWVGRRRVLLAWVLTVMGLKVFVGVEVLFLSLLERAACPEASASPRGKKCLQHVLVYLAVDQLRGEPPDTSLSAHSSTNRARWALTARSSFPRSPPEWPDLDLLPPLLLPPVSNGLCAKAGVDHGQAGLFRHTEMPWGTGSSSGLFLNVSRRGAVGSANSFKFRGHHRVGRLSIRP